jgi:NAD(P)-dependent dehydrogenase (short-subunit alcohol dehydrogenase family)
MTNWTVVDIPIQSGKLAVVTGSTGGLGFETALVLAQTGAEVVLTGRNDAKGHAAIAKIHSRIPAAKISYETLDLASLASVTDFAKRFAAGHYCGDRRRRPGLCCKQEMRRPRQGFGISLDS